MELPVCLPACLPIDRLCLLFFRPLFLLCFYDSGRVNLTWLDWQPRHYRRPSPPTQLPVATVDHCFIAPFSIDQLLLTLVMAAGFIVWCYSNCSCGDLSNPTRTGSDRLRSTSRCNTSMHTIKQTNNHIKERKKASEKETAREKTK